MRARIVKPGLFSDFGLSRLPIQARYLFVGLWCLADREGRLIDSPRFIAGQVFPHDDGSIEADVTTWLSQLEACGFIQRYEVNGGRYILVTNFKKHQHINQREAPSLLPPPKNEESTSYPVDSSRAMHVQCTCDAREAHVQCTNNARAMHVPNGSGSGSGSGSGISGVRKLPDTPLPPTDPPPPLKHAQKSDPAPTGSASAPEASDDNSPLKLPTETALMAQVQRRGSGAVLQLSAKLPPGQEIELVRLMLLDWMEQQAARLPPPDDELCRRLLQAHGMSLDGLRDWLLSLRRRGKRPESVQSWGWFAHLAEAEAARDGPAVALAAAGGAA